MYRHYVDGVFTPIATASNTKRQSNKQNTGEQPEAIAGGITNILKNIGGQFSIGDLDSGDILLVLIILLLFLEGDNLELVITLGLMLLLGLNDPIT